MTSPRTWQARRTAIGALVLLVAVAVAGPAAVATGVTALDPRVLLLGVALNVPATVACAWRWRVVSARLGSDLELRRAVAACYASQFLNTTLPGGVVGDLQRGVSHGRRRGGVPHGLRTVLWERLAGQVVLVALTVGAVVAGPWSPPWPSPTRTWVAALAAGGLALAVAGTCAGRIARWATRVRGTIVRDAGQLLARQVWPRLAVASVVATGCQVATYLVAARAVGVSARPDLLVTVVLVVFVAAALPVNVAGWGPREGAAAWCFAVAGLGAEQGLATGVAFGVLVLVANLPGAVVLAASVRVGVPGRSRVGV